MKIEMFKKTNRAFVTFKDGTKVPMLYKSAELLYNETGNTPCIKFHRLEKHGFNHRDVLEIQNEKRKIIKYCEELNF